MAVLAETPRSASPGASRVFRNVMHLAGGQIAATLSAVIWLYFVPRAIGPRGVGEIAIATAVTGLLVTLLNPGVGPLITRDVARHPEWAGGMVGAGIMARLAGVAPAALVLAIYIRFMGYQGELVLLIWLAAGSALFSVISGAMQSGFAGLEQMQYLGYANAIGNAMVRFAAIVVVIIGFGVVTIMQANLALTGVLFGLNLLWARGLYKTKWRPAVAEVRYVLSRSLVFWVGSVIFTTYLWIDTVILSTRAPVEVVGWYNTATQIFAALLTVPTMLATAGFPRLARAFKDGPERFRAAARPALETIVLVSLPMSAGLALIAGPLMRALYGPSFAGASWALAILGLTMLPTFFNMLAYQVLLASNRQMAWIKVVLVATVVNIGLNFALITWCQANLHDGAVGAALALLLTEIFESACALWLLPNVLDRGFVWRATRCLIATVVMGVAVRAAGLLEPTGWLALPGHNRIVGHLSLFVQIIVGGEVFVLMALLLRLPNASEQALLSKITSRVPGLRR